MNVDTVKEIWGAIVSALFIDHAILSRLSE